MRVCSEYKISKTQLFNNFTLEDIFDAIEYMDRQYEIEFQHSLQIEGKYKKNGS